jgi:hypothetical protein
MKGTSYGNATTTTEPVRRNRTPNTAGHTQAIKRHDGLFGRHEYYSSGDTESFDGARETLLAERSINNA